MCGIDGSRSGLPVDGTGRITGFRKIGATVGLAGKASANIPVHARLVNAGYGVRYDSTLDQYEVDTDSSPMIFTRRRSRGKGKRSPHYSHVMEQAFVETVSGNKARFTRRKGAAAELDKEILSKFAHVSWKGVTDQVERGIKNLPIAGADLRRARTIWKLTEASMKGKSNRQKQMIVTPDRLTVDPTGSGTHVEEIERICQTLKNQIRCHFHDLPPFVMCKMLLCNQQGGVENVDGQGIAVGAIHR